MPEAVEIALLCIRYRHGFWQQWVESAQHDAAELNLGVPRRRQASLGPDLSTGPKSATAAGVKRGVKSGKLAA